MYSDADARAKHVAACDEARTDRDVCLAGDDWLQDHVQLRRVVLPVPVDADRDVVAALVRVAKARLHGATDPEVKRKPEYSSAVRPCDFAG